MSIFDPTMPTTEIKAVVDAIARQQVDDEMGPRRYALLFKPGTYGTVAAPLHLQIGYYTELAGLGALPTEVTINGHVDVYNRCLTPTNCVALNNFWRSLSNLTINVSPGSTDAARPGISGPSRRRRRCAACNVTGGKLLLMDYCTAGRNSRVVASSRIPLSGWSPMGRSSSSCVRDSSIGGWSNAVWNQVFAGVQGAPADSFRNRRSRRSRRRR